MHDIIRSLIEKESVIETGTIDEYIGGGKYRLKMKGRELIVRSAVSQTFPHGTRVVINRAGESRYIIGATGQLEGKIDREVVIDA
jgi:hypothetical protein